MTKVDELRAYLDQEGLVHKGVISITLAALMNLLEVAQAAGREEGCQHCKCTCSDCSNCGDE